MSLPYATFSFRLGADGDDEGEGEGPAMTQEGIEAMDANAERTSRLVELKLPMPYFRRDEGSLPITRDPLGVVEGDPLVGPTGRRAPSMCDPPAPRVRGRQGSRLSTKALLENRLPNTSAPFRNFHKIRGGPWATSGTRRGRPA